jgi:molecular chaperone GrpE
MNEKKKPQQSEQPNAEIADAEKTSAETTPADSPVCENQAEPLSSDDPAASLKGHIQELEEKIKAGQDKYLRLMAEFDNFKRRTSREHQRMIEAASETLMLQLIEIREIFERALNAQENSANLEKFVDGMKLLYGKFDEILKKNGLDPFAEIGDEFNPQLHDALMRRPDESVAAGHIAEIYQKGYKIKDRVIRHAKVIVSEGKPAKPQAGDTAQPAPSPNAA